MVSFQELWHAEPEAFAQAAQRWEVFGGAALAKRHGELVRLIGTVGAEWDGEAREAAVAHLNSVASRIERDLRLVGQIPPLLFDHSRTITSAQQLLRGAVATAEGTPISIAPDGSVRIIPRSPTDLALLTNPSLMAVLVMRARAIAEAIGQALAIATKTDDETASRLRELLPERGAKTPPGGSGSPRIPPPGTSPQRVNEWWDGLSPAEQFSLIHSNPQAIGNLDGVTAEARDAANRLLLASMPDSSGRIAELERLGESRSGEQTAELQRLQGIEAIRDRLQSTEPQRAYLLGFDPSGNGKAIVAVGNPDTADNVATYVPGTGAGLHSVPTDMKRADLMVREADKLDPGSATSAIMWIGYEAPQDIATFPPGSGDAIDPEFAQRAGPALDSFQHGLRATHEGPPSHNTVLGHSYGSTVVGHAAKDHGLAADDVIFVGSPGVGAEHVTELGLEPGQVWSSHAENDPIQYGYDVGDVLAPNPVDPGYDLIHGRNPSDPGFGGRTFASDPGTPVVTVDPGPWYKPWETDVRFSAEAHSQYWDPHSSSLANMTLVVIGKDEKVY